MPAVHRELPTSGAGLRLAAAAPWPAAIRLGHGTLRQALTLLYLRWSTRSAGDAALRAACEVRS